MPTVDLHCLFGVSSCIIPFQKRIRSCGLWWSV